jgi:oxygen-independent coproporphyrinogen-3 oxidase
VPFCASRCGYCDFNTYVGSELGGGALQASYADTAATELRRVRAVLGDAAPQVDTGLRRRRDTDAAPGRGPRPPARGRPRRAGARPGRRGHDRGQPDSVDERSLTTLREGGFTRVSFGMQSAVTSVLRVLERTHTTGRAQQAAKEAFAAGFEQVSLDLIYGTPGETDDDWRASLDAALSAGPTHVSAYALIVEDGTRLGRQVAKGLLPAPTTTSSPTATCSPSRPSAGSAGTR